MILADVLIPPYHARIITMTDIGEPFDPDDDTCIETPHKEHCKAGRYEKQMAENRQVIRESASIIQTALDKLAAAARELEDYGDAPLEDLERR